MPSIRSIAALSAAFVAIALLVTAPAAAQTGSLWHDQKLSDMQQHDRDKAVDSRADQHYQMGLQHMTEIQRLLGDDDLGKRAERRLGRSYERAVKNFESAIEAAPEWIQPYVMLVSSTAGAAAGGAFALTAVASPPLAASAAVGCAGC
jgi:hypothetical protein